MFIKVTVKLAAYHNEGEVLLLNTDRIKYVKKGRSGSTVVQLDDRDMVVCESVDEIEDQLAGGRG